MENYIIKPKVEILCESGETYTFNEIISFSAVKERYTPYFEFSCRAVWNKIVISRPTEIYFYLNDKLVHHGIADKFELKSSGRKNTAEMRSRSFSVQLCTSQPLPQVLYNKNLDDIFALSSNFSHVTYDSETESANYMYFKESGSIWDAVTAYGVKVYSFYPYISGNYHVSVKRPQKTAPIVIASDKILEMSSGSIDSRTVSDIYMLDMEDNYSYHESVDKALAFKRVQYIKLDRQWLTQPQLGLKAKIAFASRANKYDRVLYKGYSGEELLSRITAKSSGISIVDSEVSKVRVFGGESGVFTELECYYDDYCNVDEDSGENREA